MYQVGACLPLRGFVQPRQGAAYPARVSLFHGPFPAPALDGVMRTQGAPL